jgi:Rrf2 family protein
MRLVISRRADLATRSLVELASSCDRVKGAELAARLDASAGFLAQALTPLVNRGWVRSDPGPTGGYTMVADVGQLCVLDVIEAVEGQTDTAQCVLEDRACNANDRPCALHGPWAKARTTLLAELGATPISSLIAVEVDP